MKRSKASRHVYFIDRGSRWRVCRDAYGHIRLNDSDISVWPKELQVRAITAIEQHEAEYL
jgi:hypothetical protein